MERNEICIMIQQNKEIMCACHRGFLEHEARRAPFQRAPRASSKISQCASQTNEREEIEIGCIDISAERKRKDKHQIIKLLAALKL